MRTRSRWAGRHVLALLAMASVLMGARLSADGLSAPRQFGLTQPDPIVLKVAGADAVDGDPVDLGTGLYFREEDDLAVADTPPITLRRTYRSNDLASKAFGIGASHPYDLWLVGDAAAYAWAGLILADSGRVRYVRISPGTGRANAILEHTASPTEFYKSRLTWNGRGWDITLRDGRRYSFLACTVNTRCALIGYRDRDGRALWMARDVTGDLTSITTPNKGSIKFIYDSGHRITSAAKHAGGAVQAVTYDYDGRGRLIRVRRLYDNVVKEFTYDDGHRMLTSKEPGIALTNTYDHAGRVITQVASTGQTLAFRYVVNDRGLVTQTDVTQSNGTTRRVVFNATGYALKDTFLLGTPAERTIVYDREASSSRIRSLTVTCTSGGKPLTESAPMQPGDTEENVKSRLLQKCR